MLRYIFLVGCFSLATSAFYGQASRKDSLQGGLRVARTDFDWVHVEVDVKMNPDEKMLSGKAIWKVDRIGPSPEIQIDLHRNFKVDSIIGLFNGRKRLAFRRDEDAVFATIQELKTAQLVLEIYYHGQPHEAYLAPWDGGIVYSKDHQGLPWIGIAVQGMGGSMWYPSKDHPYDEPQEGAIVRMAVPNNLMMVGNGQFLGSQKVDDDYTRWDWQVTYPINSYNLTFNIGDYERIEDRYKELELTYYVLRGNRSIAMQHFAEVKPMLACFEEKFGAYPFLRDGYKLVETPYLGMEHQSAIAYGNRYTKGYLGEDISGTGVGMLFDFITVHESAHEWFGNSISARDIADMWIHEGFTTYAETVFVECTQSKEAALRYIKGQRKNIQNDRAILGQFDVNHKGSGDMYYKGAHIIHSLRTIVGNDPVFWQALRGFYQQFQLQNINGRQVIDYWNKALKMNFTDFWEHHLTQTTYPELVVEKRKGKWITYFENVRPGFSMPVPFTYENQREILTVKSEPTPLPKNWNNRYQMHVDTDHILLHFTIKP